MRPLLNTLYVTTPGSYLARDGETVAVRLEHETRLQIPIHTLGGIVCFGAVTCTPPLMSLCSERGVGVSFLSDHGRFLARVTGPVSGNVLLRRRQYRVADDAAQSSDIARSIVAAKVANSRHVLQRALRESEDPAVSDRLGPAVSHLEALLLEFRRSMTVASIRGYEGEAARTYFSVFDHLIASSKDEFFFHQRSRRPPLDNVNSLLSFLYTLLTHDCASALETVGLDPAVGFLHEERPGRPSLALDLVEELRPMLADRLALSLINRRQILPGGFSKSESGAVLMDDATRKQVLVAFQQRKQEEVLHPVLQERIPLGLLPHVQATLLARHLRGDLDGYPPYFWR